MVQPLNSPDPKLDVSILIVAYNSAALIGDCLTAIEPACRKYGYEILLIDNGDGSTEALVRERYPRVRIVPSRGNIGFAEGNNVLAEFARGPRLLLLNPDMALFPNAIDRLIDGAMAYPQAAAWGGLSVDAQGKPDTGNAIAVPSLIEMFGTALGRAPVARRPILGIETDAVVEVLSGGFVMFSREAWDQARGFDRRYFLYCEEVDLFYRLSGMGYKFWRIAGARGFHDAGHGEIFSPNRILFQYAGRMEFARRYWSSARVMLAGALLWLAAFERWAAGRLLGAVRPRWRNMAGGYRLAVLRPWLWLFGYHPEHGLMARQRRRTRSDVEVAPEHQEESAR